MGNNSLVFYKVAALLQRLYNAINVLIFVLNYAVVKEI